MAGEKKGQITSADDATNIPDNDGFDVRGKFDFYVLNGTTIAGTLQVKTPFGNLVNVPDTVNGRAVLAAADVFNIQTENGGKFRIAVTTATGTWDWWIEEEGG